jgi:hypothetical protein
MSELQSYFNKFHEKIKLDDFKENSTLRDKRDIVLGKLKDQLKKIHEGRATIEYVFIVNPGTGFMIN